MCVRACAFPSPLHKHDCHNKVAPQTIGRGGCETLHCLAEPQGFDSCRHNRNDYHLRVVSQRFPCCFKPLGFQPYSTIAVHKKYTVSHHPLDTLPRSLNIINNLVWASVVIKSFVQGCRVQLLKGLIELTVHMIQTPFFIDSFFFNVA